MTSIPAEFYALANAFLFALHNMFTKKALRYSNPATAVISSLLINIIFLWGVSILFVPLSPLTSASILIFVVVGFFQPGLTRLLSYKGIDALGVAITDPIRATTPLFSAAMAIIFLGEKITLPIIVATMMIIAGITLLSWRSGSMKLAGARGFSLVSDRGLGARGRHASSAQVRYGRSASPISRRRCDRDVIFRRIDLDALVRRKKPRDLEDEPPMLLVVSRRRRHDQPGHDLYLLCARSRQSLGGDSDQQHRPLLFTDFGLNLLARRGKGDAEDCHQCRNDCRRGGTADVVEVKRDARKSDTEVSLPILFKPSKTRYEKAINTDEVL